MAMGHRSCASPLPEQEPVTAELLSLAEIGAGSGMAAVLLVKHSLRWAWLVLDFFLHMKFVHLCFRSTLSLKILGQGWGEGFTGKVFVV